MEVCPSVLIVDDHQSIRDPLSTYLGRFNFAVEAVADGKAMRQRLAQRRFDLILLDVMLPGENGLSLCRYVSEHIGTPVILLTAAIERADRIVGLEIGADDYIVKPFDPRELVARARSVLRRARAPTTVPPSPGTCYLFSGWRFDTASRELHNPQAQPVAISTAEFHLLRALVENANRVLTRNQLMTLTQRTDAISFDRSIDSQISRLRKKFELDSRNPVLLKTVRGDGYMLATKVSVQT